MTKNWRRTISSGAALLLLAITSVGAASDVADAVQNGDTTAVRRLVTAKADVNAPQPDGATALHWAVYRDDLPTVDLLLKAGANAKAANSSTRTSRRLITAGYPRPGERPCRARWTSPSRSGGAEVGRASVELLWRALGS